VIKIQTTGLRRSIWVTPIPRNRPLGIGDRNPLGENFTFTVTAGIVSAKGRACWASRRVVTPFKTSFKPTPRSIPETREDRWSTCVASHRINAAIASETGLFAGYGLQSDQPRRTVMTQLISTGHVERAVMGVSIRPITPEDAEAVG